MEHILFSPAQMTKHLSLLSFSIKLHVCLSVRPTATSGVSFFPISPSKSKLIIRKHSFSSSGSHTHIWYVHCTILDLRTAKSANVEQRFAIRVKMYGIWKTCMYYILSFAKKSG